MQSFILSTFLEKNKFAVTALLCTAVRKYKKNVLWRSIGEIYKTLMLKSLLQRHAEEWLSESSQMRPVSKIFAIC